MNDQETPTDGAKTGAVDHILIFDPVTDEIFVNRNGKSPRPIQLLTPVEPDSKGDHD